MTIPYVSHKKIEDVFENWRKLRPIPARCKLTKDRSRLIQSRLRLGYTVQDLVDVIDYIYKADEPDARWMRGDNPRRRKYLDLEHLLRVTRLGERVEAAALWKSKGQREATDTDTNPYKVV